MKGAFRIITYLKMMILQEILRKESGLVAQFQRRLNMRLLQI